MLTMPARTREARDRLLEIESALDALLATPEGALLRECVREVAAYEARLDGDAASGEADPLEGAWWRGVIRSPEMERAYLRYRLLRAVLEGAGGAPQVVLLERCPACRTRTALEAVRWWCINPTHPTASGREITQSEIALQLRGEWNVLRTVSPQELAQQVEDLTPELLDTWAVRERTSGEPEGGEE
jgi:hypothetical protein